MISMKKTSNFIRGEACRSGVATVELAVVLPMLVAVFLGGMAVSQQISLQQNANILASTAALQAVDPDRQLLDIQEWTENYSAELGVKDTKVTVARISENEVAVDVSLPYDGNSTFNFVRLKKNTTARAVVYRSVDAVD